MKVLIVGNQARSTYVFWGTLIKAMAGRGHEVVVAVPDGASLKDVQALHTLSEHGIEVLTYPLDRRSLHPLKEWKSLRVLCQLMRDERPDKVFAFTIKSIIYSAFAMRWALPRYIKDGRRKTYLKKSDFFACITGLGYGLEEGGGFGKSLMRWFSAFLYALALGRAKKVFFQNPEDEEYFLKQGIIPRSKQDICVECRGTGVNVRHFALEASYPACPTFLLMARLLESKGIQDFVLAARILKGTYAEARFQILGPAEDGVGAVPVEHVQGWHDEGSIEYLGHCQDVRPHIKEASVMVLPSWREGVPCAILEGMSMGRAAVVSDVPGCRQAVQEGYNGFLVPPKNPVALAEALERFIVAPHLVPHMGAKGRQRAEKYFDAEHVAQFLLQHMKL